MSKILLFEFNGNIIEKECNPEHIPMMLYQLTDLTGQGDVELLLKFPYYEDKISVYGWKKGNDIYLNRNTYELEKLNNAPLRLYGTFFIIRQDAKDNYLSLSLDEYNTNMKAFLSNLHIKEDTEQSDIDEYENNIKYLESIQNSNEDIFHLKKYIRDNFL